MLYFERFATVSDVLNLKASEDSDHMGALKVPLTANLNQLITYMSDHDIGVVFVYDQDDKIVGLISERDIMRHLALNETRAFNMPISDLIKSEIFACKENDRLKSVASDMAQHHVRHIAVKDEADNYIGIVSSSDIERFAGQG